MDPYTPNRVQRLVTSVFSPFAAAIEADSRAWKVTCPCGHTRSVWEAGGIRWLAAGEPRRLKRCEACGETTWHRVHKP